MQSAIGSRGIFPQARLRDDRIGLISGGEPGPQCRAGVVIQLIAERPQLALLAIEAALNRFAGLGIAIEDPRHRGEHMIAFDDR